MAAEFLRRMIGKSALLPPEVMEARAELEHLAAGRATLRGPAMFLHDALEALYGEDLSAMTPALSREQAAAKWNGQLPLLRGETLALDVAALGRRWQTLCAVVDRHQPGPAPKALADAWRRGRLDATQLLEATLAGRVELIHAAFNERNLDAGLAGAVLRLTLFPDLCRVAAALAPLRAGAQWDCGYCPMCGSWPLLGEFRGLEQTRHLRCGLCAASWEFGRLRCPFCATTDHRQLGYFQVEGEETRYRAATCAACQGCVKMVSTLGELSPPQLLVADVATTHLDLVAAERGYEVYCRFQIED